MLSFFFWCGGRGGGKFIVLASCFLKCILINWTVKSKEITSVDDSPFNLSLFSPLSSRLIFIYQWNTVRPNHPPNVPYRVILLLFHISFPNLAENLGLSTNLFKVWEWLKRSNCDVIMDDVTKRVNWKFQIWTKGYFIWKNLARGVKCWKPYLATSNVSWVMAI